MNPKQSTTGSAAVAPAVDFVTYAEAAKLMGRSRERVRQLANRMFPEGVRKIGRVSILSSDQLEQLLHREPIATAPRNISILASNVAKLERRVTELEQKSA